MVCSSLTNFLSLDQSIDLSIYLQICLWHLFVSLISIFFPSYRQTVMRMSDTKRSAISNQKLLSSSLTDYSCRSHMISGIHRQPSGTRAFYVQVAAGKQRSESPHLLVPWYSPITSRFFLVPVHSCYVRFVLLPGYAMECSISMRGKA